MTEHGRVSIQKNIIKIINPVDGEKYARITPCKECALYVNEIEKKQTVLVKAEDKVLVETKDVECERTLEVTYSEDKIKAYITMIYKDGKKYSIDDSEEVEYLTLRVKEEVVKPKMYTRDEIMEFLKKEGISYGINNEVLNLIVNTYDVNNITIAEGIYPIDAIEDEVYFLDKEYKSQNSIKNINEPIDYKNLNKIHNVREGSVIAKIKQGSPGIKGVDVFGKCILPKKNIYKEVVCGKGCEKQEATIIATVNGQVFFRKNKVTVNEVYNVERNVDISTGNINFNGNLVIKGNVTEGMTVVAQNSIRVLGSAFTCNIISNGDIDILGNIMSSKISAGGKNIEKEHRLKSLIELEVVLKEIIDSVHFLTNKNLLKPDQKLGLIIKSLVDTKFTEFNNILKNVMTHILRDEDKKSKVLRFIKSKLIGIAFVNITNISEIEVGLEIIEEEIAILKSDGYIESDIRIMYCQESFLQSTNDIEINGKGAFGSQFYAGGQVVFKEPFSVFRGGKIIAKNYIKASIVGSEGGVETILEVESKNGSIKIDKAYNNTKIIIGNRESFINIPSRDINCYIDRQGDLIIEKFVL